jgi:hypothetical protein
MYLAVAPHRGVRGAYVHDDGVLIGRWDGAVLHGWWCELPSRAPPGDAGEVEMRFTRGARGLRLDGRWRYGSASSTWHDDWDANPVDMAVEPLDEQRLRQRLQTEGCPGRD